MAASVTAAGSHAEIVGKQVLSHNNSNGKSGDKDDYKKGYHGKKCITFKPKYERKEQGAIQHEKSQPERMVPSVGKG